jgi:LAS superfamily LD-carboxypeptidase LdcB
VRVPRLLLLPGLALLAGTLLVGRMSVSPANAGGSLPTCHYLDVVTAYHAPADWKRTLVDTTFMVPRSYAPRDLVAVSRAGIAGASLVRALVIPDLEALATAARAAGSPIAVQSGYRSYAYQVSTFQGWVDRLGYKGALEGSARAGHSEHQLGVAIDVMAEAGGAPWEARDWATTPAGAWMKANAWKFGFVMSYPKSANRQTTCYAYEPWHYRYVGREMAAAIHDANVTLREYLWYQLGNDVMASLINPSSASPSRPAMVVIPHAVRLDPTAVPGAMPEVTRTPVPRVTATTTTSPGQPPSEPISPAGASLAVAIGVAVLVAVEQLDRIIKRRLRRIRPRPVRRRGPWQQARRSSSVPTL